MSETAPDTIPRLGSLPDAADQAQAGKDRSLTSVAAVDLARGALAEITLAESVGEHVAATCEAERLVTHLFECALPGYRGWRWAVTLSRLPRSRTATVCEMELLPGEDALLAPAWVPWADRLRPEDLARPERSARRRGGRPHGLLSTGEEPAGLDGADSSVGGPSTGPAAPRRPRVRAGRGAARAASRWFSAVRAQQGRGQAVAACSSSGLSLHVAGALRAVLGDLGDSGTPGTSVPTSVPTDAPGGLARAEGETATAQDRAASAREAVASLEAELSGLSGLSGPSGRPALLGADASAGGGGPARPDAAGPSASEEADGHDAQAGPGPEDPGGQGGSWPPRTLEELEASLPRH